MEETGSRDSCWDELNDVQKIKRLYAIVKQQSETIDYLMKTIQALLEHEHNQASGDIMVKLKRQNYPKLLIQW